MEGRGTERLEEGRKKLNGSRKDGERKMARRGRGSSVKETVGG